MMAPHAKFTMKGSPSATCTSSIAACAAGADMASYTAPAARTPRRPDEESGGWEGDERSAAGGWGHGVHGASARKNPKLLTGAQRRCAQPDVAEGLADSEIGRLAPGEGRDDRTDRQHRSTGCEQHGSRSIVLDLCVVAPTPACDQHPRPANFSSARYVWRKESETLPRERAARPRRRRSDPRSRPIIIECHS